MYDGKHDRGRALWAGICRLGYAAYTAAGAGEFDELLMTGSRYRTFLIFVMVLRLTT